MRKLIAALLAAATLTAPVFAQGREPRNRGFQPRGEVSQPVVRDGMRQAFGGQREQRQERREFRQEQRGDRQEFRRERRDDRQEFRQERRDDRGEFRQERRDDRQDLRQGEVTRREFRRDRVEDRRDFQRDRFQDRREFRQNRRDDRSDFRRDRNWNGGNRWNNNGSWNRDWRRDPRYNWQDWRRSNRNWNFGRYYAPRGWSYGYRRFSLGVILSAPLFGQSYWLDDPWQYRLPPADGPYRWVRYYDDVLLVDIRDGRVVDVIYDFFW